MARAVDGRRQRGRKIINEEREKSRAKNGSLRNTSTNLKGTTFVILINHSSGLLINQSKLLILESLYIQQLKPSLNLDSKSFPFRLFNT